MVTLLKQIKYQMDKWNIKFDFEPKMRSTANAYQPTQTTEAKTSLRRQQISIITSEKRFRRWIKRNSTDRKIEQDVNREREKDVKIIICFITCIAFCVHTHRTNTRYYRKCNRNEWEHISYMSLVCVTERRLVL